MARTFRRHRQAQPIADLNVTNLIDLGFTLLIIFMIATNSTQEQTIPVNLPSESKSTQQKPDKETRFESVAIDAKGAYFLSGKPMTFRELAARLKELGTLKKPPVIRIRGDGNVPYQKVVGLMDELKKNNLLSIQFDTQPSD